MIVENLIKNGSFENDKNDWSCRATDEIVPDGVSGAKCLKRFYTDTAAYNYASSSLFDALLYHKYYLGAYIKSNGNFQASLYFYGGNNNYFGVEHATFTTAANWQRIGYVAKVTQTPTSQMSALLYSDCGTAFGASNYVLYDAVICLDLTQLFGEGNEPAVAWCNEHINYSDEGVVVDYERPSSDGPRSMGDTPLVSWIQPVTDRVASDAVYGNSKGSLDSTTLNRIEQNLTYLQQALGIAGMPAGRLPGNLLTREVLEACSTLTITDTTVDGYACMKLVAPVLGSAEPLAINVDRHKLYLIEACNKAEKDGYWGTCLYLSTRDGNATPDANKTTTWQTYTYITTAPLIAAPKIYCANGTGYPAYYRYLCMYELNSQWRRNDYYLVGKFNQLKHDIMQIRASGLFYADTPELTDSAAGGLLGYQEMNNIERVLYDAKQLLDGMKAVQRKLGTFNAGSNYQRQYIRSV